MSIISSQQRFYSVFLGLLVSLVIVACDDNDTIVSDTLSLEEKQQEFTNVLNSMGGKDFLLSTQGLSRTAKGQSFETYAAPEPLNEKVSDFSYTLSSSLDMEKIRQQWTIDTQYPFIVHLAFSDIINGKQGRVEGEANSFASALFGAANDPMFTSKLATRKKTLFMSSPFAMLKKRLSEGENFSNLKSNHYTIDYNGQTINLVVDNTTKLPISASTLEADPLYGDVVYQVTFTQWQPIANNGRLYPRQIQHSLDDTLIRNETINSVSFSTTLNEESFALGNDTLAAFDAERERIGLQSSQFFMRMLAFAIPLEVSTANRLQAFFLENDKDVLVITDGLYHSYAFKTGDSVVLYDTPQNDARSLAVLTKINENFPNLPVRSVLLSHNHFDHSGGFRGALAQGAELVVGSGSVSSMNTLLARPLTVAAQPLTSAQSVLVTGIDSSRSFGEGAEQVVAYRVNSIHSEADDMLVLYKPSTQTLFFADLYNAGFGQIQRAMQGKGTDLIIKKRAQSLVDSVNQLNLNVAFIAPTHGGITSALNGGFPADISYQSVLDAAAF
jgi:glyoxylase-like metal-dependent hydrolase (beta-lactamase superfamily II)